MKLPMKQGELTVYKWNLYGILFEMGCVLLLKISLELNMELPTGPTGMASTTAEQVSDLDDSVVTVQWNLWIMDTLGAQMLPFVGRLFPSQRLFPSRR